MNSKQTGEDDIRQAIAEADGTACWTDQSWAFHFYLKPTVLLMPRLVSSRLINAFKSLLLLRITGFSWSPYRR